MAKPRGMTVKDRAGERHGRLTVLFRAENRIEPSGAVRAFWHCLCDCGEGKTVSGQALARGRTRSCGCLARERPPKHGKANTKVYRVWHLMKQRCLNPASGAYHRYGGRGITLCREWHDFGAFHRDMGDPPFDGATLERIDNDKGYSPDNCRWATRREQSNNTSTNRHLTFRGHEKTVAEWGRVTGLGKERISQRIKAGWPIDQALSQPLQETGLRRRKKET